jgi:hypothetical protein
MPAAAHGGLPNVIPAGFDLFETDPATTHLDFDQAGGTAVPGGFFDPGCEPFTGVVSFGGVPIGSFAGQGTGDADTVVNRLAPANLSGPPATIPIEIVELSLRSMEPIQVRCGAETQLWQVDVSLSENQQQGQMQIHQETLDGGVFNSVLPVTPVLTLTRIGDSETRVIDGAEVFGPEVLNRLRMSSNNVAWRFGCIAPALAIPGLNDTFCPGQTPEGQKVLTQEQAVLARHGVYPVQPSLEHFQCYKLAKSRFQERGVTLTDQFGTNDRRLTKRAELCTPVRKNGELLGNRRAHLTRYRLSGPPAGVTVATLNQFGSQRLAVGEPDRLMVPTEKQLIGKRRKPIETQIDHFQCYGVEPLTEIRAVEAVPRKVKLQDQFRTERVRLRAPKRLCAPVDKNGEGTLHPVRHLLCYAIEGSSRKRKVRVHNQLDDGKKVVVRKPKELCVPTLKQPVA